jgi:hypothetical protein
VTAGGGNQRWRRSRAAAGTVGASVARTDAEAKGDNDGAGAGAQGGLGRRGQAHSQRRARAGECRRTAGGGRVRTWVAARNGVVRGQRATASVQWRATAGE